MHAFVFLCLISMAAAGYNYEPQTVTQTHDGAYVGGVGGSAQLSQPIDPVPVFNKEFYTYTAPDNVFNDAAGYDQLSSSLKRNLRVIFIKGPDNNGLENAALQLAKSASDDRTAIYVLSKQADVSDLANKLSQLQHNHAHKPEVHFVKYRTQADAENAQRTIQQQYDSLPGTSTNSQEGQAPVLDFASKAPAPAQAPAQPQATYLPPGRRV